MKDLTEEQRLKNKEYQKAYREANRDRLKAYDHLRYHRDKDVYNGKRRQHRAENPELYAEKYKDNKDVANYRTVKWRRVRSYGVDEPTIQEMMDDQKGCCKICGDSLVHPNSLRSFSIDHCHSTGSVRGLLCPRCNLTLGGVGDNINLLQAMIDYLEASCMIASE